PSTLRHLGVTPSDLEGRRLADWIHPEDRQLLLGRISLACVDKGEYGCFCRFRRLGGGWTVMEVRGHPVLDDDENEVRFLVQSGREYRSKATLAIDSILELRIENLRLRRRLEEGLVARGVDPSLHPLLRGEVTETAPSAHPFDLDEGGNLRTSMTEEDFLFDVLNGAGLIG
ncbi:blue light receptor, partial [Irineochytrium annulatum]